MANVADIERDSKQELEFHQPSQKSSFARRLKFWQGYIDRSEAEHLKAHKYSGSDEGFAYVYFYNPVANWLVQFLPDTLAPNTLTVLGFAHTLIPVVVMFSCFGPELYGDLPNWFCFFQAWCFFSYRMLDEMDGKQARRTQNSSPLGLIFDHGCDSFSMGFQAMIMGRIFQIGNNLLMSAFLVATYGGFHFATLEEYYVGTLRLPPLNAVSDGSVIVILLCVITGCIGNNFWATQTKISSQWLGLNGLPETFNIGQFLLLFVLIGAVITFIANWIRILYSRKHPAPTQCEQVKIWGLFLQIFAFLLWTTLWYVYAQLGSDPVSPEFPTIVTPESAVLIESPGSIWFLVWLFWFEFVIVHQTISIQLCHVTRQKYNPFTNIFVMNLAAVFIIFVICFIQNGSTDMKSAMAVTAVATFICQWQFIISIILEITRILDIMVFTTHQGRAIAQSNRQRDITQRLIEAEDQNEPIEVQYEVGRPYNVLN